MPPPTFYNIISHDTVHIAIPRKSHFSLGTSPYYAHQHGLALDIYQQIGLDNYRALSPVEGRVLTIKKMRARKGKYRIKGGIEEEYLLLIENRENPEIVYKILHIKPIVREREIVEIGDPLGTTLRNGYFAYWSSPHLHLEVRASTDAVRARGGKFLNLNLTEDRAPLDAPPNPKELSSIPIIIEKIYPEFILGRFPDYFYCSIDWINGVRGTYKGQECILDGGFPLYQHGVSILPHKTVRPLQQPICLGNSKIGVLQGVQEHLGFVDFNAVKCMLDGHELRGISLFLSKFTPYVKFIPRKMNALAFQENSTHHLTIQKFRT
ncbi:MAG: hypothetical protein EU544_00275 [Promethearchaeota archaeon]|nr:MAG: hypothetical protein EU544_00275 [Candidatus Lokiarchaeota archaeon]